VDELLTGEENLQLMADLHHLRAGEGKRVVTSLLERFDLTDSAQKMAATYSGGMRRKLDLAMTLVTRPRIIFLDEPTTGLDPRSRRTMWHIVRELAADGVTVFLTTQNLEEADQLAGQTRSSTRATWSPRARPANSSASFPAATSGSSSPTSSNSTRQRGSCPAPRATTRT
jgi:ABC-2 type transport system ATP-binding protein